MAVPQERLTTLLQVAAPAFAPRCASVARRLVLSAPTALSSAASSAVQHCCNCSKDTQSHCYSHGAAAVRRQTLWQCLSVEYCERASWSPHLAPKSFDGKNISEPHLALVIKAPLLITKSASIPPFKL